MYIFVHPSCLPPRQSQLVRVPGCMLLVRKAAARAAKKTRQIKQKAREEAERDKELEAAAAHEPGFQASPSGSDSATDTNSYQSELEDEPQARYQPLLSCTHPQGGVAQ